MLSLQKLINFLGIINKVLSSGTLCPQAERCCSSLLVSSPSLALDEQPEKLGTYHHVGSLNCRRVYKHSDGNTWLYYYDWGGRGTNWMFGDNPGSQFRGIESMDLAGRALHGQWCPEKLHITQVA